MKVFWIATVLALASLADVALAHSGYNGNYPVGKNYRNGVAASRSKRSDHNKKGVIAPHDASSSEEEEYTESERSLLQTYINMEAQTDHYHKAEEIILRVNGKSFRGPPGEVRMLAFTTYQPYTDQPYMRKRAGHSMEFCMIFKFTPPDLSQHYSYLRMRRHWSQTDRCEDHKLLLGFASQPINWMREDEIEYIGGTREFRLDDDNVSQEGDVFQFDITNWFNEETHAAAKDKYVLCVRNQQPECMDAFDGPNFWILDR